MTPELHSTAPNRTASVLLLEADPATRSALTEALGGLGYRVRAEVDGPGMERAMTAFQPDVALIGVRPGDGGDSLAVARWVRARAGVPVLFIGATRNTDDIVKAFDAGADDYLVRPFVVSELVARMEAVLRHTPRAVREVFVIGDLSVDLGTHTSVRAGQEIALTHREFAVLAMLCRHAGSVLSKGQLMAEVWGGAGDYRDNVVEVHVSGLRRKLDAHGPRLIHTVRGAGYVLRA